MLIAASDNASSAGDFIYGMAGLAVVVILYWMPTIVAVLRKVPNLASVAVVNGFLGWTFIGWVAALAMAVTAKPQPIVVNVAVPPPGLETHAPRTVR